MPECLQSLSQGLCRIRGGHSFPLIFKTLFTGLLTAFVAPLVIAATALVAIPSARASTAEIAEDSTILGGSRDILVIQARDARIIQDHDPRMGQILLEPLVFEVLWEGVVEGEFQYLRIGEMRFFINYNVMDNSIYAYDCLGGRYLVVSRTDADSAL